MKLTKFRPALFYLALWPKASVKWYKIYSYCLNSSQISRHDMIGHAKPQMGNENPSF